NACIDELKNRTKQKEAEMDYANAWLGDDSFIEGPAIQAQTLDKMLALIETLSPELFEVYFLIYVEGKRPGDAARLLDITDQELYKRHRKLKEQLGKYLGPGYMWILLSFSILLNTIKAN